MRGGENAGQRRRSSKQWDPDFLSDLRSRPYQSPPHYRSLYLFFPSDFFSRFDYIFFFVWIADILANEWSGLAGTHDSWGPQIKGLTGTHRPNDDETMAVDREPDGGHNEVSGIEVCAFDNRGMGRSAVPTKKTDYT